MLSKCLRGKSNLHKNTFGLKSFSPRNSPINIQIRTYCVEKKPPEVNPHEAKSEEKPLLLEDHKLEQDPPHTWKEVKKIKILNSSSFISDAIILVAP